MIDNLNRITYPTDNEGKLCGYDPEVLNYPYLYYTSLTDPVRVYIERQKDYVSTSVHLLILLC